MSNYPPGVNETVLDEHLNGDAVCQREGCRSPPGEQEAEQNCLICGTPMCAICIGYAGAPICSRKCWYEDAQNRAVQTAMELLPKARHRSEIRGILQAVFQDALDAVEEVPLDWR